MWTVVFPFFAALLAVQFGDTMPGLVGAPMDANVNDEGIQNALRFAVAHRNRGTNDIYLHDVVKVTKAQKQLVAGMKYILEVEMAKTSCRKNQQTGNCSIQTENPYTCNFTVWSRPWINDIQLLEEKCA